MKDWDKIYKTEKNPFGSEPSLFIKNYLSDFPKDKPILDLGSGDGRNAIFLAQKGFDVTCVDISKEALGKLTEKAKELRVQSKIKTIITDIAQFKFETSYGLIICYTILHFLLDADARRIIQDMQRFTLPNGLNIVTDFVGDGPLKRANENFWLEESELKLLYKDWKTLYYKEELSKTRAKDESGNPLLQRIARIVAQKLE